MPAAAAALQGGQLAPTSALQTLACLTPFPAQCSPGSQPPHVTFSLHTRVAIAQAKPLLASAQCDLFSPVTSAAAVQWTTVFDALDVVCLRAAALDSVLEGACLGPPCLSSRACHDASHIARDESWRQFGATEARLHAAASTPGKPPAIAVCNGNRNGSGDLIDCKHELTARLKGAMR